MRWRRCLLWIALTTCTLLPDVSAAADKRVLKQDPPRGGLRSGETVYVDDGSCPSGQIKKVTGGSDRVYKKEGSEIRKPGGGRTSTCVTR